MKKRCDRLLLGLLLCSLLLVSVKVRTIFGNELLLEKVIDDVCTIQIRVGNWEEGGVPIYLQVDRKGEKALISSSFSYQTLNEIETKQIGINIQEIDNIIYLYKEDNPHKILAVVFLEENVIYPPYGLQEDSYHHKIRNIFLRLKKLLNDEDLILSGNPWYTK